MNNEALTAHVGVSAPETPKYLLLNNFLADFSRRVSMERTVTVLSISAVKM